MRRTTYLAVGLGVAAIATLLVSLWSGSSGAVPQVFASNGCLASDLNGNYSALYQGWNIVPKGYALGREPYIGFAALIVVSFDGSNGISGGAGAVQLGVFNRSFTITEGTYFLDTDCTGELTFKTSDGVRWHHRIHVTGSGEEYQFLRLQNPGFDVELLQFGTARRMDLVQ